MSDRGRAKPRRRDVSSQRYFHQQCGYNRSPTTRGVAESAPSWVSPETKTMIRLDGDSIAYFWALENETSISHETLTLHWRAFIDTLMNSWPRR